MRLPGPPAAARSWDLVLVVALVAFGVVALGPALLGQGTLLDVDGLTAVPPFRAIAGRHLGEAITCRGDTYDFFMPGIAATRHAFFAGSFPTWAPYEVGGSPLASLPNHAALSPLSLPYYLVPLWLAPAFVKLLELVVGIGGMFAFLRRHGVSRAAALFAGIVFVSSGFMMMWTNWPQTRVAALIPALFWALERVVQQHRGRDVVLLAVVVASMLLGGFPAVTLFALSLGGVYVLARLATGGRPRWRRAVTIAGRAAAGVLLGAGLSAVQLVPFVYQLGALNLSARESVSGVHLPVGLFSTTVAPDVLGLCVAGETYGQVNPIEGCGYLGAAAIALVALTFLLRRPATTSSSSVRRFALVALPVLVVLIWMGGPLLSALQQLPLFSSNGISRAQSVFGFVGAVLAGLGLDVLLRRGRPTTSAPETSSADGGAVTSSARRRRDLAATLVVTLVIAGFVIVVLRSEWADAVRSDYLPHLKSVLLVPGVLLVLAVLAIAWGLLGPRRVRWVGPLVVIVLGVGQSAAFAHTMLPLSSRDNFYPVTPTHTFLQHNIGGDRYGAGDGTMDGALSDWYRLRTPVGHEFTAPAWKQLLLATDPDVALSPTYSRFSASMRLPRVGRSSLLDQFSVRYWVSAPGDVVGREVSTSRGAPGSVELRSGQRLTCTVAGGPLRAVGLEVAGSGAVPVTSRARLLVSVDTPTGVLRGSRSLAGAGAGRTRTAVLGESLPPGGSYRVELRATDLERPLVLRTSGGVPDCAALRPRDDGLRLVSAGVGANVWERSTALPRVRWASRSQVVPSAADRITLLRAGVGDDTVLLDDGSTPGAQGASATTRVVSDRAESITTDVTAGGRGYLVLADSIARQGWTATVDGRPARIVPGNHAFAAVAVPAGRHRVVVHYGAPGLRQGVAVSAASWLVVLGLLVGPVVRRRRRERMDGVS